MEKKKVDIYTIPTECKKDSPKNSFFHINKNMIRFKAHYFLYIGAMGIILPFIPVIARNRLGLSATALASVLTASQFMTIISKPLIGYIVDYYNNLKFMISTLIILQTACNFLILAVPSIRPMEGAHSILQSPEILIKLNKSFESFPLTIKLNPHCENFSFENNSFQSLHNTTEEFAKFEKLFKKDVACISQLNETFMECHYLSNDTNGSIPQMEWPCCCTVTPVSEHPDVDIQLLDFEKHNFNSEYNFTLERVNETLPCSVVITGNEEIAQSSESRITSDFLTYQFWLFAVLHTISMICGSSIFTLGDTACSDSVQKYGEDFGRQRLHGSVGWGILSPVGGLLCDLTGDYLAAWILMAVLLGLALWNLYKLDIVKPHMSDNLLKDVGTVLKSGKFLAFELSVFMNGMGAGVVWFYVTWFVTSLGGSKFLCGLIQYVQCVAEIPFMFYSGWFIKKIGHFNLISTSLFFYGVRSLWYSYLQKPWLVLPAEVAHSFNYGLFFPAVASFGKLSAKPGTEATTQSILFTTHGGLGAGLGCVIAGIGFDSIGGHQTFFYASIFSFCATAINIMNTFILDKKHTKVLNLTSSKKPDG